LKYLIFSDVHGNLEALESVLAYGRKIDTGFHVCLGDILGYGANPNECVEAIRKLKNVVCVKGNHDAAVVDPEERSFFHSVALEGVYYTDSELTEQNREFIVNLPYVYASDGQFLAVHASPYKPESWEYILDQGGAKRAFGVLEQRIGFVGHSHTPAMFTDDGRAERLVPDNLIELEEEVRYLVNVGSVGQPRDGNPDASFAVFDDAEMSIKAVRVPYDNKKAAEKILKAGLPPVLAERLLVGY
jgi:diadenosine tetraphosphatase ApaH/serine/threonine PP2A family protein phosphatase